MFDPRIKSQEEDLRNRIYEAFSQISNESMRFKTASTIWVNDILYVIRFDARMNLGSVHIVYSEEPYSNDDKMAHTLLVNKLLEELFHKYGISIVPDPDNYQPEFFEFCLISNK